MITQLRLEQIKEFEDKIGYTFNDKSLIDVAFTHSSYTNEAKTNVKSNERLEFLGDSVLDLVVSEVLFKNFNNKPEGWLTKTRSRLVCTDSFAKASEKYDLTSYLNFGKGEKQHGGGLKKHVKADTFEAVCAAIYLDAGFDYLYEFLVKNYTDAAKKIIEDDSMFNDYKTRLQEYHNAHDKKILKYTLINQEGPEHDKILATGVGKNKKKAEQDAAKNAYERIKND